MMSLVLRSSTVNASKLFTAPLPVLFFSKQFIASFLSNLLSCVCLVSYFRFSTNSNLIFFLFLPKLMLYSVPSQEGVS